MRDEENVLDWVNIVMVQAITEFCHTGCDLQRRYSIYDGMSESRGLTHLIELDAFLSTKKNCVDN